MKTFFATTTFAFLLLCFNEIKAQNLLQRDLTAVNNNSTVNNITHQFNTFQNDREHYWRKHKTFKTLGWVSIGVGIPLTLVGAVSSIASNDNTRVKKSTSDVLAASGLILTASSIPFFILSSKYKKKANSISVSLKSETINLP